MLKQVLLLGCLLMAGLMARAQKVLVLENPVKFKRFFFFPGDFIRFQGKDGYSRFSGRIEAVDDSMLVLIKAVSLEDEAGEDHRVYRDYVPLHEIGAVYPPKRTTWSYVKNIYSGSAMIGGGGLIGLTAVNALIYESPPDINGLIVAGGILVSGFIMRYIGRDKYKIGPKWQIRTMEQLMTPSGL